MILAFYLSTLFYWQWQTKQVKSISLDPKLCGIIAVLTIADVIFWMEDYYILWLLMLLTHTWLFPVSLKAPTGQLKYFYHIVFYCRVGTKGFHTNTNTRLLNNANLIWNSLNLLSRMRSHKFYTQIKVFTILTIVF